MIKLTHTGLLLFLHVLVLKMFFKKICYPLRHPPLSIFLKETLDLNRLDEINRASLCVFILEQSHRTYV